MLWPGEPNEDETPLTPGADDWIVLDDEQVDALLQASFVDRLFAIVERDDGSVLAGFGRADRFAFGEMCASEARSVGLVSESDRAGFLLCRLRWGPGFERDPRRRAEVDAVIAGDMRWSDAVVRWDAAA